MAAYASLKPLKSVAVDPAATAVLERLGFVYPHKNATTEAAARSVTSWTKNGPLPVVATEPEAKEKITPTRPAHWNCRCSWPRTFRPRATDLGNFTHLVLEKLDFARLLRRWRKQIASMIDQQILTDSQARVIDRGSIEWFLESELGQRIRENAGRLHRELPVNFGARKIESTDRNDQIMLRGRLDAFLDLPAGGVVIDYKTDRVKGPTLTARIEFYEPQLRAYLAAMSDITKREVTEAYLVFLHPKEIVKVSL